MASFGTPQQDPQTPQRKQMNGSATPALDRKYQVVVDENITVTVQRNSGEDCSRIITVDGYPRNGNLRVGQFLIGAALGSAKMSFNKLANHLVENELERLKAIKKPYTLIVSDKLERNLPSRPELTHETPERAARNNPQEKTPFMSKIDFDSAASPMQARSPHPDESFRAFIESENQLVVAHPNGVAASTHHEHDDGFAQIMQLNDLGKIQQSLEKLRNQRFAVERLRGEMLKKDSRIQHLTESHEKLRTAFENAQQTIDKQNSVFGKLEIAKERIKVLEQTLSERQIELENTKSSALATEEFLRSSIENERAERDSERAEAKKADEALKEEIQQLDARVSSEKHKNEQLLSELQAANRKTEEARFSFEEFRTKQMEKISAQQRTIESVEADRDDAFENLRKVQAENQNILSTLKSTREALSASDQRANMLAGTVEEQEENNVVLRKHILELEKKHSQYAQEMSERAKIAEKQLAYKIVELEETLKKLERIQDALAQEATSHKTTKAALARREKECENQVQHVKRLSTHVDTMEAKLSNTGSKFDAVHEKLMEERNKNSILEQKLEAERRACREWATTRLELLNQFCEEEERMRSLF